MKLANPTVDESHHQRIWRKRLSWWLAAAGAVAILGALPLMGWDQFLSESIRLGDLPGDIRKAIELSEAFAHGSGATAILLTLLLTSKPPRKDYWMAVTMTASSGIFANLLKAVFTRARPYTYDSQQTESASTSAADVTGWEFLGSGDFWDATHKSFPSGHTATAWGLAIGLSLLFPRATLIFIVLATLATFQRLVSGAHFPSDALAGFGIACLMCALTLAIATRKSSG